MLTQEMLDRLDNLANQINELPHWQWESPPGNQRMKLRYLYDRVNSIRQNINLLLGLMEDNSYSHEEVNMGYSISEERIAPTPENVRTRQREALQRAAAMSNAVYSRGTQDAGVGLVSMVHPARAVTNEEWARYADRILEESAALQQQVHQGLFRHSETNRREGPGESVPAPNLEIGEQAVEEPTPVQGNTNPELLGVHGVTGMHLRNRRRIQAENEPF